MEIEHFEIWWGQFIKLKKMSNTIIIDIQFYVIKKLLYVATVRMVLKGWGTPGAHSHLSLKNECVGFLNHEVWPHNKFKCGF